MSSRRLAAAAALLSFLVSAPCALATSTGITGYSGKPPSPSNVCNACHTGGTAPSVTFDGPSALGTGATGTFTFMLQSNAARQSAAGFNVAASGGTLQVVSGQKEQIFPGTTELTHNAPKPNNASGQSTWQFKWKAPTTAGDYMLWGAGNSVNLDGTSNGDRAAATMFLVAVGGGPTVTPSFTTTPSPARTSPPTASPTATPTPSDTSTPEPTVTQVVTPTSTHTPTETPASSPTFTPTPTPTPPDTLPTPGDANCDGTVSAADISSLVALLEGIAPLVCGGVDANQNGMLDEGDLPATIDVIFQETVLQ